MDEKMIKQIVLDCGYQALGLYSYLFSPFLHLCFYMYLDTTNLYIIQFS